MFVSVALCTYNGREFLREQLDSIFAQSLLPDEIVIGDDDSSDGTRDIIESFVKHQELGKPQLRLLPPSPRAGVVENFSRTIAACDGDVVILSDQDDIWHEHRVRDLANALAGDASLLLVHSNARLIDEHNKVLAQNLFQYLRLTPQRLLNLNSTRALEELVRGNVVTGATTAVRKELYTMAQPFSPLWLHDEWLGLIAAAQLRTKTLPDMLIDYRQHDNNVIGAGKKSFRYWLGFFLASRQGRNKQALDRLDALLDHLGTLSVKEESINLLRQWRAFEFERSQLSVNRLGRIDPAIRLYRAGKYRQFRVHPWREILRDLTCRA
jgi:glycosyltransferase involved in cell wall biosynthesis